MFKQCWKFFKKNNAQLLVLIGFVSIIIAGLALMASLQVNYDTNKLIERQLESIAPQYPLLEISTADDTALVLGPSPTVMSSGKLQNGGELVNLHRGESDIIIYNRGKLETGRIYLSIESPALNDLYSESDLVYSISGESLKLSRIYTIFGRDVNYGGNISREMYDYNVGVYDANIVLTCEFCQAHQQTQKFKTQICLWKETSANCNDFVQPNFSKVTN